MTTTDLVLLAVTLVATAGAGIALGLWDTARRRYREAARAAVVDPVTGLPNRAGFHGRLHRALTGSPGAPTAVLFCDLDDFKAVNDTHGHATGDRVLAVVARRLRHAVRAGDVVARYGGDEFTVLATVATTDDAEALARRVHAALAPPIVVAGGTVRIRASIGVAVTGRVATRDTRVDDHAARASELVGAADHAMYRAKRGPRDRAALAAR